MVEERRALDKIGVRPSYLFSYRYIFLHRVFKLYYYNLILVYFYFYIYIYYFTLYEVMLYIISLITIIHFNEIYSIRFELNTFNFYRSNLILFYTKYLTFFYTKYQAYFIKLYFIFCQGNYFACIPACRVDQANVGVVTLGGASELFVAGEDPIPSLTHRTIGATGSCR